MSCITFGVHCPGLSIITSSSSSSCLSYSTSPPTFLLHTNDDKAVPVENSILFYKALIKSGVSTQMHLYPEGGHGFALALDIESLKDWPLLLYEWILQLK